MIERRERDDIVFQQRVDQAAVEVEPALIDLAASLRQDARPGNREAVGPQTQLLHQRDILAPAVVVVAGQVAGAAVLDTPWRMSKAIPDRLALAVFIPGTFDLVGSGCRAPQEALGKA